MLPPFCGRLIYKKRGVGLQELRNHEKWEQTKSKNIGFSLSHFANLLLT